MDKYAHVGLAYTVDKRRSTEKGIKAESVKGLASTYAHTHTHTPSLLGF